jgi:hypothetical protein
VALFTVSWASGASIIQLALASRFDNVFGRSRPPAVFGRVRRVVDTPISECSSFTQTLGSIGQDIMLNGSESLLDATYERDS